VDLLNTLPENERLEFIDEINQLLEEGTSPRVIKELLHEVIMDELFAGGQPIDYGTGTILDANLTSIS